MQPSNRAVRARRLALKLALAVLFTCALLEGGLRFLTMSDLAAGTRPAEALRQPGRWATSSTDLYWRLVHLWRTSEVSSYKPPHDERLGWTWWNVEPGTYRHHDEPRRNFRRPVLLFGDSYSAGLCAPQDHFQNLMERSALADDLTLLNYGVCGYGLDQIYLMVDAAIDRHLERDPIVVVGLLVDNDLNRSLLSLREHPKPRLRIVNGHLFEARTPVPTLEKYLAGPSDLPAVWSWTLAQHLFSRDPLLVPGTPERREMEELNRLIVRAIVARLRERELDFFFLLFHTKSAHDPSRAEDWRHELLRDELEAMGVPWYDDRVEVRARVEAAGAPLADFFIPQGQPGADHPSGAGNAAAFATILRGLKEVAGIDPERLPPPNPRAFRVGERGRDGSLAVFAEGPSAQFARIEDSDRILLRAGDGAPLILGYRTARRARRFLATAWVNDPGGGDGEVTFEARVDGVTVWERRLRPSSEPLPVELDLRESERFEWVLAAATSPACLVLADPRFE